MAFLDIIGLLLNRTLMVKTRLAQGQKDDVLILLGAIRNPLVGDDSIGNTTEDLRAIRKRIDNFRSRFVASIAAGDPERRWRVYLRILGKLFAAGTRAHTDLSTKPGASEVIASNYAESLLNSLRAEAGVSQDAAKDGSAAGPKTKTTKAARAKSNPSAPGVSTILEILEADAASVLLRTSWWPEEMRLLWIYEEKDFKRLSLNGKGMLIVESPRATLINRMFSSKFPELGNRFLKATKETAMAQLRRMLHVEKPARIPSTIVFDLRGDQGAHKPKAQKAAGGTETDEEDEPLLKDAIAKLAKWLPRFGTKDRPIYVVVISDDPDDATHAAIKLDKGTENAPTVAEFLAALDADKALDVAVNDDANEEDTLTTAVHFAALPVNDTVYAPVRWERDYAMGPAASKPMELSLVSATAPTSGPDVRYQPKEMRVFFEGAEREFPIVPHVALTDANARRFVRFLAYGSTDHASQVRVIDATDLTMPSDGGKGTPEEKRGRDLNVALLLAVAMHTPSVLIVTPAQSARMRLELGWMDRVFANGGAGTGGKGAGPGADTGGKGAGPGADTGASGASSAAAGSPSQLPKSRSASAASAGARSKSASPSADLPPRKPSSASATVEATVDEYDGATVAGAGTGKGGKSGVYFKIFGENLRIVKHGDGEECPQSMLSAAAEHIRRLAQTGSDDKLEFLVGFRLGAAGKSVVTYEHHSKTGNNASSIYLRCAPAGTDGPLDLDYPDPSSSGGRDITSDQGDIARIVNEAMGANTKIFIVCMEAFVGAAHVGGAKQPAVEGSVGTSPSQSWGYY